MGNVSLSQVIADMFRSSLQTSMQEALPEGHWDFSSIDNSDSIDTEEALFLTICSHQFRVFVAIHFSLEDCREFVAAGLNIASDALTDKSSYDFLLEISNSVCGMLKRDLGNAVPALGMSTPNILERGSFNFIELFKAATTGFQKVELNNKVLFYAAYYYCPNVEEEIEVDFVEPEIDIDSGELELF